MLPQKTIVRLSNLIKIMFKVAYFVPSWKVVKIIALPKHGKDSSQIDNIRPVDLLSNLNTFSGKIISKRFRNFADKNKPTIWLQA